MFGLDIMRQVQEMQSKAAAIQEELGQKTVTASSGGGMVTVVATGKLEIVSVSIDPSLLGENDASMAEELVAAAANEALRQARELVSQEMRALTGGISIPGLF